MSLAQKYRKSKEERWCLRFTTIHPDRDAYHGVVTEIKQSFIVLSDERDFEFGAWQIFPKKAIKGYRDGHFEKCTNEILRHNGQIKNARSPRWLGSCSSIPKIMEKLQSKNIWPGIEVLFNNKIESAFYLGPIVRLVENGFFLKCYGADGKWEKEYKIHYSEIFRIQIGGKYNEYFNTYMQSNGLDY